MVDHVPSPGGELGPVVGTGVAGLRGYRRRWVEGASDTDPSFQLVDSGAAPVGDLNMPVIS